MSNTNHIGTTDLHIGDQQLLSTIASRFENTWSSRRARLNREEKYLMAKHFMEHYLLIPWGENPVTARREPVALILVNQGTTPNIVVKEALEWVKKKQEEERSQSFDITWYTPGSLVPATLRKFRNTELRAATQLFLFPGRVDFETEAVSGPEAVEFARNLKTCFTYAFLSAYAFDINDGTIYFNYREEVELQQACALRYAAHKCLFLDSSKFKREGNAGYRIDDLLATAETVTIYTVSSQKDPWIKEKFKRLCDHIFNVGHNMASEEDNFTQSLDMKSLRLQVVGKNEASSFSTKRAGFLNTSRKQINLKQSLDSESTY